MCGFDTKNKLILNKKFICQYCSLILKDPVQLNCGHRQCQSCFQRQHEIIKCQECSTESMQDQIRPDENFKNEMQSLTIDCFFCDWSGILQNYQEHLDQNHINPQCKYCHAQFDTVVHLNEHKILACEKNTIDCLLKDFGCDKQIHYHNMWNHYSSEYHQNLLIKTIQLVKSQIESMKLLSTQIHTNLIETTVTTIPVNLDLILLHELFQTLNIQLDNLNIGDYSTQEFINNALFQYQRDSPTSSLDLFKSKLSEQESLSS
ncbi:unnamed protein product [Rotaria sordida]|uniref:RING-type domain-containing protein n=2 Tax=Rotaria sordida TaxID=392033 RepID=A0A819DDF1_9BILA|nr:unnamed protein product [Rotaria sordida]